MLMVKFMNMVKLFQALMVVMSALARMDLLTAQKKNARNVNTMVNIRKMETHGLMVHV